MKKICVITGSRAEYGLLKNLIKDIKNSPRLKIQLIVTGMHLSSIFGNTLKVIETDGLKIDYKINLSLNSDTSNGLLNSMGIGMKGFAKALSKLKPDAIMILGDRYEIFIAAVAATISRIPIIHLHGGEVTEGAFDESIRHCISKMSHLHFVAAEEYRKRVIQLGEQPSTVFNVGGLGVDSISKIKLLSKKELQNKIKFNFLQKNLLITYHPTTLEPKSSKKNINEILTALSKLKNTGLIFTMPNADLENKIIIKKITQFCQKNPNAKYYKSLGQKIYFSCIKHADGVLGNSSSGLLEVPTFKKGSINIGNRQKGRLKAESVIDCEANSKSILQAIKYLFSKRFIQNLSNVKNPYGKSGASKKIIKKIEKYNFNHLLKKKFYDI